MIWLAYALVLASRTVAPAAEPPAEALGACRLESGRVHCWNLQGRPDPGLEARARAEFAGHRMYLMPTLKTRFVAVRWTETTSTRRVVRFEYGDAFHRFDARPPEGSAGFALLQVHADKVPAAVTLRAIVARRLGEPQLIDATESTARFPGETLGLGKAKLVGGPHGEESEWWIDAVPSDPSLTYDLQLCDSAGKPLAPPAANLPKTMARWDDTSPLVVAFGNSLKGRKLRVTAWRMTPVYLRDVPLDPLPPRKPGPRHELPGGKMVEWLGVCSIEGPTVYECWGPTGRDLPWLAERLRGPYSRRGGTSSSLATYAVFETDRQAPWEPPSFAQMPVPPSFEAEGGVMGGGNTEVLGDTRQLNLTTVTLESSRVRVVVPVLTDEALVLPIRTGARGSVAGASVEIGYITKPYAQWSIQTKVSDPTLRFVVELLDEAGDLVVLSRHADLERVGGGQGLVVQQEPEPICVYMPIEPRPGMKLRFRPLAHRTFEFGPVPLHPKP